MILDLSRRAILLERIRNEGELLVEQLRTVNALSFNPDSPI